MTRARSSRDATGRGRWIRRTGWLRLPRDARGRRTLLLTVIYGLCFLLVAGQLVRVQVLEADGYADQGAAQRARTIELAARRGRIYDREGAVLASSIDAATIYADPRAFRPTETPEGLIRPPATDPEEAVGQLAPVLGLDPAELRERLTRDSHFEYLARQVDWEVGERIEELDLHGVGVLTEAHRVYPAGSLASQVVGFTGIDGDGLHGLELQYDELLTGSPGQLQLERAPGGLTIASGAREVLPAEPGTDLVLTMDREIQHEAESTATRIVEEHAAAGASVVVLEVATGDVLAMANAPSFDPNVLDESQQDQFRNRALTDVFEPGSVQKAVTAAAAVEAGVVGPDSVMRVHDEITIGPKTFSDAHEHPPEDMTFAEVIETSSNVGTIMVAQQLGAERLHAALEEFGYGRRTDLGFPGAARGLLLPAEDWWITSLPTIAIGQGVAVTLLQAATAYATIANDGVAVAPRLVRGTVGEDGRLSPGAEPDTHRVVSAETAGIVQRMLAGVVQGDRGTGTGARVAGFTVAGKTGTARKPRRDARGYSGEYVATFVGFAPAEDPEIVVAVMADQPRPIWGGVVAAPAFASVMEFALSHRRVRPADDATRTTAEAPGAGDVEPSSP